MFDTKGGHASCRTPVPDAATSGRSRRGPSGAYNRWVQVPRHTVGYLPRLPGFHRMAIEVQLYVGASTQRWGRCLTFIVASPPYSTSSFRSRMVAQSAAVSAFPQPGPWGHQSSPLDCVCSSTTCDDVVSHANSIQCPQLAVSLGAKVNYPNSTSYNATLASYWSLQEGTTAPNCIVVPTTSQDVSTAVSILSRHGCDFAIKSQGHAPAQGFANIEHGVTIDLTSLTTVQLNQDLSVASLGTGQNW